MRKRGAADRVAMIKMWGGHVYYALKGLGKLPDYKGIGLGVPSLPSPILHMLKHYVCCESCSAEFTDGAQGNLCFG